MASGRKCAACSKTMLMMDPYLTAEGGFFHKECFKCTHCKGQLTLANFAQIKGVLYCKPHYKELFSRRGKYDDIDAASAAAGGSTPAATPAADSASAPVTPVVDAPSPAPAPAPAATETAAEPASAPAAAPEPEPAPASAPAPAVEAPVVEAAKEPAPAAAPTITVPAAVAAVKEQKETPKPTSSGTSTPGADKPRFGGSSTKCAVCVKTVYPADPQYSSDGSTWHRECFKCCNCKGQLSLSTWAQLEGKLFDKACFFKLFGARGKYDDVLKAVAEKEAAEKGFTLPSAASGSGSGSAPVTPAAAAVVPAAAEAEKADDGVKAEAAVAVVAEAESKEEVAAVEATPAAVEAAAEPAPAAVPEPEAAPKVEEAAAPAAAPEPAPAPAAVTPVVEAPKPITVPAPAPAAKSSGSASNTPADKPRFGGSSTKCAICVKTVYPADPQYSSDGSTWHRECFKCCNCKGQLSLSTWAQLEGKLFDKACFFKLFGARGKYDDVLKAVAEKEAAEKATA